MTRGSRPEVSAARFSASRMASRDRRLEPPAAGERRHLPRLPGGPPRGRDRSGGCRGGPGVRRVGVAGQLLPPRHAPGHVHRPGPDARFRARGHERDVDTAHWRAATPVHGRRGPPGLLRSPRVALWAGLLAPTPTALFLLNGVMSYAMTLALIPAVLALVLRRMSRPREVPAAVLAVVLASLLHQSSGGGPHRCDRRVLRRPRSPGLPPPAAQDPNRASPPECAGRLADRTAVQGRRIVWCRRFDIGESADESLRRRVCGAPAGHALDARPQGSRTAQAPRVSLDQPTPARTKTNPMIRSKK